MDGATGKLMCCPRFLSIKAEGICAMIPTRLIIILILLLFPLGTSVLYWEMGWHIWFWGSAEPAPTKLVAAPEIDASGALTGISLLSGVLAVLLERKRRKQDHD
jgi:hypothetical protein